MGGLLTKVLSCVNLFHMWRTTPLDGARSHTATYLGPHRRFLKPPPWEAAGRVTKMRTPKQGGGKTIGTINLRKKGGKPLRGENGKFFYDLSRSGEGWAGIDR